MTEKKSSSRTAAKKTTAAKRGRKSELVKPAAKRTSPARSRATAQRKFSSAIAEWLKTQGFTVGMPEGTTEWSKERLAAASKTITGALKWASVTIPDRALAVFIKGGEPAKETDAILRPFVELCDLLALQMQHQPNVFLLIYADALGPAEIMERLSFFYEHGYNVTQFGLRLFFEKTAMTCAYIHPVLVFFDPAQKNAKWHEVKVAGWKASPQVILQAGCIDVAAGQIEWTTDQSWAHQGVLGWLVDTVNDIGRTKLRLDAAALQSILRTANVRGKQARKRPAPQTEGTE